MSKFASGLHVFFAGANTLLAISNTLGGSYVWAVANGVLAAILWAQWLEDRRLKALLTDIERDIAQL